jgi:hypothetical protein
MTGTELEIVTPATTEILGPDVDRLATLHTNARTDHELLAVWIKSHADGSPHTVRVCQPLGKQSAPGDRRGRAGRARHLRTKEDGPLYGRRPSTRTSPRSSLSWVLLTAWVSPASMRDR